MITSLAWLGLAIEDPDASTAFYDPLLGSPQRIDDEVRYRIGESELRLKPPGSVPKGGEHVHFAFSTGPAGYAMYKDRLAMQTDTEEHELSAYRSVYGFDPDDHCIEFAAREETGEDIAGIFEIVLEVESLKRAEAWYESLDGRVMDRGDGRRRVRLDMGPFELELWEPHRGIANARPGRTVDLGILVNDTDLAVDRLSDTKCAIERDAYGATIIDPDGHHLSLLEMS